MSKNEMNLNEYAACARAYLKMKKVYRYHLKKIEDMEAGEVIRKCHDWYTDNGLVDEYRDFEDEFLTYGKKPPET